MVQIDYIRQYPVTRKRYYVSANNSHFRGSEPYFIYICNQIANERNQKFASMIYLRNKLAELRLELFALLSQKWTVIKQGLDTDLVFVQDNINFYRREIIKVQNEMKGGK